MRKIQKALSWLLVLTMLLSLTAGLTVGAFADDTAQDPGNSGSTPAPVVTSGKLDNDTVQWNFDTTTGTLTVGLADGITANDVEMTDFDSPKDTPWYPLADQVKAVVIQKGIQTLASYSFADFKNLTKITFESNTLWYIHRGAFRNATSLTGVVLPENLRTVYAYAFNGCTALNPDNTMRTNQQTVIMRTGNETLYYAILGGAKPDGDTPDTGDTDDDDNGAGTTPTPGATSGTCGNDATWSFDTTTGTLTIAGTGSTNIYVDASDTPWAAYMTDIKAVEIKGAISRLGNNAFNGATALKTVTITTSANMFIVSNDVFKGCTTLPTGSAYIDLEKDYTVLATGNEDLEAVLKYKDGSGSGSGSGSGTTPTPPPAGATSGPCGANATWEYNATLKTLTLRGSGPMMEFPSTASTPWAAYLPEIERIIDMGISSIGANAFTGATSLHMVMFSGNMVQIGANAFKDCPNITTAESPLTKSEVTINAGNDDLINAPLKFSDGYADTPGGNTPGGDDTPGGNTPGGDDTPGGNTPGGNTGNEVGGSISGTTLTWTYSPTTHALNIKGTGEIPDFSPAKPAPWAIYADEITAITVQDGITRIGNYSFANMKSVIDVYLPKTLKSIGSNAFRDSTSLQTIDFPKSLEEIGSSAFRGCTALTEVTLPAAITTLAADTFRDCSSLKTVNFNENLKEIGENAFNGCKALEELALPEKLTTIGKSAFYGCSGLKSVTITSKLQVKENAFSGCSALNKVFLDNCDKPVAEAGNEPLMNHIIEKTASGTLANGVTWTVDRIKGTLTFSGNGEALRDEAWLKEMPYVDTVIFRDGITGIGANFLKEDPNVTSVVMADTVKTIGDSAFELCANLESVTFSNGLTTMGKNAFKACSSLTEVALPDSLKVIPEGAFSSCTALTKAALGNQVTAIGADAFENCTALKEIEIPASTETIGLGAFKDCTALETVILYAGKLAPLNKGIFVGCTGIKTVDFAGTASQWETLAANADEELTGAKVEYVVTLTIYFDYRGAQVGADWPTIMRYTGKPGEEKWIEIPTIPHYKASYDSYTFEFTNEDKEIQVFYDPIKYDVSIVYVDAATGTIIPGTPSMKVTLAYGATQWIPTLEIPGYTAEASRVEVRVGDNGETIFEVKYTADEYSYTVEFVNGKNNHVFHSFVGGKVPYMGTVTLTSADFQDEIAKIKGYTVADAAATYTLTEVKDNTQKIQIVFTPENVKVTVSYVDEDGKTVKEKVELDGYYYGQEIELTAPAIEGLNVVNATFKGRVDDKTEITFNYQWKTYKITVNFLKDTVDGAVVHDAIVIPAVKHGTSYTFKMSDYADLTAPVGYELKLDSQTIDQIAKDEVINFVYTRKQFTVTIYYVNEKGEALAGVESYQMVFPYGSSVEQLSPVVAGHTPDKASITIQELTENQEFTVKYTRLSYQVTIHLYEAGTTYEIFGKPFTATVLYGDSFTFNLADHADYAVEAYTTDKTSITIDAVTEDVENTIFYTPKTFTLTVKYEKADGTPVDTKEYTATVGRTLEILKWEKEGYEAEDAWTIKAVSVDDMKNPVKTVVVEEVKTPDQDPDKDPDQDPDKDPGKDPDQDPDKDPDKDPNQNPGDDEKPAGNGGKIVLIIVIILLVLGGGGAAFYFLYMKKPY